MRFWLSVLCVVLMGHWWHAVAMPITPPLPISPVSLAKPANTVMLEAHGATATHAVSDHHHASTDANPCDTSQGACPQAHHSDKSPVTSCGSEHACCTLQPSPIVRLGLSWMPEASSERHAIAHKLAINQPPGRLFKPPKATL
jgi:hypothetical protein